MSSRGKIKVVIAESLPVYLDGLLSELVKYNEIEIVGETIEGNNFYDILKKNNPNIFVFDDKLLNDNFANFIKTLIKCHPTQNSLCFCPN
jgi:DNA-binding NarL/FixJ family response regulator